MSPQLRSLISSSLSHKQRTILEYIVRGKSTVEISNLTGYTQSTIKAARRKLRVLFKANSNIHLIVLAILEIDFFRKLGKLKFKKEEIDSETLDVVFLTLQGYKNEEIIEELQFPKRRVEYLKAKYRTVLGIEGDRDFVKKSIEAGILVLYPVKYNFTNLELFSEKNKKYKIDAQDVKFTWDSKNLNTTGYIFIDYLNRFCFQFKASFSDIPQMNRDLILALMLSDFNNQTIKTRFVPEYDSMDEDLELFDRFLRKKRMDKTIFNLTSGDKLKLNTFSAPVPNLFTKGQIILMNYLSIGYTERETMKAMKLHSETFEDQVRILLVTWNANSLLGVYLTFLHLEYLKLKKNT